MSTAKEKFELARQRYAATFERHLDNGVEFISDNVYIEPEVIITPGTVILPGCILRGKTVIAENCVIGPNTLLEDTVVEARTTINASQCYESHIGPNNKIGPFTHVRTGTKTAEGCHLGGAVQALPLGFGNVAVPLRSQIIQRLKPGVVAGAIIFRFRVAQPGDQPVRPGGHS